MRYLPLLIFFIIAIVFLIFFIVFKAFNKKNISTRPNPPSSAVADSATIPQPWDKDCEKYPLGSVDRDRCNSFPLDPFGQACQYYTFPSIDFQPSQPSLIKINQGCPNNSCFTFPEITQTCLWSDQLYAFYGTHRCKAFPDNIPFASWGCVGQAGNYLPTNTQEILAAACPGSKPCADKISFIILNFDFTKLTVIGNPPTNPLINMSCLEYIPPSPGLPVRPPDQIYKISTGYDVTLGLGPNTTDTPFVQLDISAQFIKEYVNNTWNFRLRNYLDNTQYLGVDLNEYNSGAWVKWVTNSDNITWTWSGNQMYLLNPTATTLYAGFAYNDKLILTDPSTQITSGVPNNNNINFIEIPFYTEFSSDTGFFWKTCNIQQSLPTASQFWVVKKYSISGGILTENPDGFLMSIQNRFTGNYIAPEDYEYSNRNLWNSQHPIDINKVVYIREIANSFTVSGPPGVWWAYYNQKLPFTCRAIPIGYNPTGYIVIHPNNCQNNVVLTYFNLADAEVQIQSSTTQTRDNLWQWDLKPFPGNSKYFQIVTNFIDGSEISNPNQITGHVLGSFTFPTSSHKPQLLLVSPSAPNTWWEYRTTSSSSNLILHPGLPSPTQTNLAILELNESSTNNTCQLPGVDPNTNDEITATQFILDLFNPLTANNKVYQMSMLGGDEATKCSAPPQIVFVPDYTSLPDITNETVLTNLLNSSWSLTLPITQQDLPQNFSSGQTAQNGQFDYNLKSYPPVINDLAVLKIFQIDRNVSNPSFDVSPLILDAYQLEYEAYPALIQTAR